MPWAKVDDTLHSHPKAMRAGFPALGLHLLALSYCAQYLTDGLVDDGWLDLRLRGPERKLPKKLEQVGMWHRVNGGYTIHDWHDYNPSKAEVMARRTARQEAGRRGAAARWNDNGDGKSDG